MSLYIYIPGSYVTGHLYSMQVAMLLDIYIPGSYVTGHLYSR